MLTNIYGAVLHGVEGRVVTCEVGVSKGLPQMIIVGLADAIVRESKERVRQAIRSCGFKFPQGRVIVNMSPAGIRKHGTQLDLPIAVGILASGGQILLSETERYGFIGELSLDCGLKRVSGVIPMAERMQKEGITKIIIPEGNREEAEILKGCQIYPAADLRQVIHHLNLKKVISPCVFLAGKGRTQKAVSGEDFRDVKGQESAKRGLTVAAAGCHDVLMTGSPSGGKTMMARRIATILPDMTMEEVREVTGIYSAAGILDQNSPVMWERPVRSPHHRASIGALLGGGMIPEPGEVTLAHRSVLFLDEIGEFSRNAIDTLRRPLEEKEISFLRSGDRYTFPSDFLLIAAMNPCPCGYYGDPRHTCACTRQQIQRYQSRISGPVIERIDIYLDIYPCEYQELQGRRSMSSEEMKKQVVRAREMQKKRYRGSSVQVNSQMTAEMASEFAPLTRETEKILKQAYVSLKLNPRTLLKTRRLARTIADLEERDRIEKKDIVEALRYRRQGQFRL